MQSDREREESEQEGALELQRLDAIERDEKGLWRRVDELIAGKTVKDYNEAVSILKDLRALALHKQRLGEFVRQVDGIRGKYSRRSRPQLRIENAKLLEGLESK
jgi:hypothetical protein